MKNDHYAFHFFVNKNDIYAECFAPALAQRNVKRLRKQWLLYLHNHGEICLFNSNSNLDMTK